MDPSIAATLVGGDFAASSIVIVFHMFTMQRWLDDCQRKLGEAIVISRSTGFDSIDRTNARRECVEVRRRFPTVQVISLGLAILALCGLAASAGWSARSEIPVFHTVGPAIILVVLQAITTAVYATGGMRLVSECFAYLGFED